MPDITSQSCGTFHFCKACPSTENCCTGKNVDLPVLTPQDVLNISRETGLSEQEFTNSSEALLLGMRNKQGKCFFYRKGKCTIYGVRPIDCRLFPFDIHNNGKGDLFLIWYKTACPKPISAEDYIKNAVTLLNFIYPYLEEFASYSSPLLDNHEFEVVGRIIVSDSKLVTLSNSVDTEQMVNP